MVYNLDAFCMKDSHTQKNDNNFGKKNYFFWVFLLDKILVATYGWIFSFDSCEPVDPAAGPLFPAVRG